MAEIYLLPLLFLLNSPQKQKHIFQRRPIESPYSSSARDIEEPVLADEIK